MLLYFLHGMKMYSAKDSKEFVKVDHMKSTTPFYKMHGAGNDFILLDGRVHSMAFTAQQLSQLADRHYGIGCDQLVVLSSPSVAEADVDVRFFNTDGKEAGACGNASRCVVVFLHGETGKRNFMLHTQAGLLPASYEVDGTVSVNMGKPRVDWQDIPLAYACDTLHLPLEGDPAAASMGNPHATFFVRNIAEIDPVTMGRPLEHHSLFPEGANIGFAEITSRQSMRLRVWERGSGLTLACGSGACAAVVNAHRRNLISRKCSVEMDGGVLMISLDEEGRVLMRGPAAMVFKGEVPLENLENIS